MQVWMRRPYFIWQLCWHKCCHCYSNHISPVLIHNREQSNSSCECWLHAEADQTRPDQTWLLSCNCRISQLNSPHWSSHDNQSNAMHQSTWMGWSNILLHSFLTCRVKIPANIQPPTGSSILVHMILTYICTRHATVLLEIYVFSSALLGHFSCRITMCSTAPQRVTLAGIIIYLRSGDNV
jgi:hypothetical protein